MSNTLNNETEIEKKEPQAKPLGTFWLVIIIVSLFVVLLVLYNWSQGKSDLTSILSPIGMIFFGLSQQLSIARNRTLRYIFLALAMIFIVVGLMMVFIY